MRRDQINQTTNKDDLVANILEILRDNGVEPSSEVEDKIMLQLIPYIVRRDHDIFNHAYHVGKASHD